MKIALDGRGLANRSQRGMDRYVTGLARQLLELGVDVSLLYQPGAPPRQEHLEGFEPALVPVPGTGIKWEQNSLARALGSFDLYHAPYEHGIPLLAPVPRLLTIHSVTLHSYENLISSGKLRGSIKDYLDVEHGSRYPSWPNLYWYLQVLRANHFLVPSEFSKQEAQDFLHINPRRITVTPLALASIFLKPPVTEEQRSDIIQEYGLTTPFILFVGGFEKHKNVQGIVNVYRKVVAQRPDVSLVLIGTKDTPDWLVREAQPRQGDGATIKVLSNIGADLPYIYEMASVFLSMSWRESFCLPLLESMSRGTPVVASDWGAGPSVAGDTIAATFVDPRDIDAATEAVLETLQTCEDQPVKDAARSASSRFTWKECASRTIEAYEKVLRA